MKKYNIEELNYEITNPLHLSKNQLVSRLFGCVFFIQQKEFNDIIDWTEKNKKIYCKRRDELLSLTKLSKDYVNKDWSYPWDKNFNISNIEDLYYYQNHISDIHRKIHGEPKKRNIIINDKKSKPTNEDKTIKITIPKYTKRETYNTPHNICCNMCLNEFWSSEKENNKCIYCKSLDVYHNFNVHPPCANINLMEKKYVSI